LRQDFLKHSNILKADIEAKMVQIRKLDEKRLKKKVKITKLREQLSAAKEQKNYDDIEFTKLMTER